MLKCARILHMAATTTTGWLPTKNKRQDESCDAAEVENVHLSLEGCLYVLGGNQSNVLLVLLCLVLVNVSQDNYNRDSIDDACRWREVRDDNPE